MKILITLFILVCASPAWGFMLVGGRPQSSTATCSTTTDYCGTISNSANNGLLVEDVMYAGIYTPVCASGCSSGTFSTGFVRHNGTSADDAKICLYLDDGDSVPGSADTLVECEQVASSIDEWAASTVDFSAAAACGSNYWVLLITDNSQFNSYRDTSTGTVYYITSVGSYTTPPANLAGTWATVTRTNDAYVEIGP